MGRLLCLLGLHRFHHIEGRVFQCRRCGCYRTVFWPGELS